MKQATLILVALIVLVVLLVLGGAFYIVDETEQVVITMFGKPVGSPVTTPGLKLKIPMFHKTNYFDKRFLEWDGDPRQITTQDKRFIWVDTYARWRISDPLKFFQRLRDERGAQSRLDDIVDGETRATIAKHELIEVVRSSNRKYAATSDLPEGTEAETQLQIEFGRAALESEVLKNATTRTADLGIEILDFRLKRINYEEGVQKEVYSRMISERKRIAEQYRSEGAGEAARINGDKERELKAITSEAYRKSQEIKGRADAEAADIYASAYNKDAEFYQFLKTMEVYRATADEKTILVLGTDGDFLRYLEKAR
jgi:membrane protease subunit HflC